MGPGVTRTRVGDLRAGMLKSDIKAMLGEPVGAYVHANAPTNETLLYAMPGGWSVFRARVTFRGAMCSVDLNNEKLSEVEVLDVQSKAVCRCREGQCSPSWNTACASLFPE
jgi:hypothetical protein